MSEENVLNWLCNWYQGNRNGDWEHNYGINIETIDNPGWSISIDLENTNTKTKDQKWQVFEKTEDDWYGYEIEGGKYQASGDPSKLTKLILVFKELVSEKI